MSEMREYQQKMLESKGKGIVLCDWDRGKGKTYSIANFIAKNINFDRPLKILIIGGNYYCRYIQEELKRIINDEFDIVVYSGIETITVIGFKDGKKYVLADIIVTSSVEKSRGMKLDYVLCDEYIPSSNELNIFYNSGAKKAYILGTFGIDYISDKEFKISNENEWIDNEINKLMCEFSSIDSAENTTKRREIILCMITKLKSMKPLCKKDL